ncbi:MAG: hypothetical protein ACTSV1_01555 [Alphaproteobacteria bacterium]
MAAIGAKVPGHQVLNRIGNDDMASAVADTLFRDGGKDGPVYIQKAINDWRKEQNKPPISTKDGIGSETFGALKDIAANKLGAKGFLDSLADRRLDAKKGSTNYTGEAARINYHRMLP